MEKKSVLNNTLLAVSALNFSQAFAEAPSKDPRYEQLKSIMREYVQQVVRDECANVEGYNFDSYEWNEYEIRGLEVVLFDILNHTKNYCKPPELTGMHSAHATTDEKPTTSNNDQ